MEDPEDDDVLVESVWILTYKYYNAFWCARANTVDERGATEIQVPLEITTFIDAIMTGMHNASSIFVVQIE